MQKTAYGIPVTSTVSGNVRYDLTGMLDGTFTVNSSNPYQLFLNDVNINGYAGPALDLESDQKAFIVSGPGTTNTLADASTSSIMKKKVPSTGWAP